MQLILSITASLLPYFLHLYFYEFGETIMGLLNNKLIANRINVKYFSLIRSNKYIYLLL